MKVRASRGQLEILNSERTERGGTMLCRRGLPLPSVSGCSSGVLATATRSTARGNGKVVATNEVGGGREARVGRQSEGPTASRGTARVCPVRVTRSAYQLIDARLLTFVLPV